MKLKSTSRLLAVLLVFALAMGAMPVSAFTAGSGDVNIYRDDSSYLVQKISNPTTGERETDGLEIGGDRQNSYAWSMAELSDEYGDYIYIGSNRNILYASLAYGLVAGQDGETTRALIDMVTNGEIYTGSNQMDIVQSAIMRYNVSTGEIETWFDSADHGFQGEYALISGFRAAIVFKDAVYFNAVSSGTAGSYIYRINDNAQTLPEVVFRTSGGGFMRAMTVSADGQTLYVGGTTSMMTSADADTDYEIVVYKTTDGENYTAIADWKDFRRYEQAEYRSSGGDVWDMVEYNGELFFTLMTKKGGIVFKAHEDPTNPAANDHGWVWEEFAGETAEYGSGFGNALNYALTPYVYNGDLYFIGFSNAMDSIIVGAGGLLRYLSASEEERDINVFLNSLVMMDENMENETAVFRLTESGRMQMVVGDENDCPANIEYTARLGAGFNDESRSTTLYNWRATIYDGKFYIGTFDAYPMFKYLTKLTNGDLLNMTSDEFRQQLEYVRIFLELVLNKEDTAAAVNAVAPLALEETNDVFGSFVIDDEIDFEANTEIPYEIIEAAQLFASFMGRSSVSTFNSVSTFSAEANNEGSAQPEISDEALDELQKALIKLHENLDKTAATEFISELLSSAAGTMAGMEELIAQLEQVIGLCEEMGIETESLELILDYLLALKAQLGGANSEGLARYVRVSNTIAANANPGCELYCTEDGVNYTAVTIDGFADEYNYGVRTLLAGPDGLYVGTANPFFGAQLWKVNEITLKGCFESNIPALDAQFDTDRTQYSVRADMDQERFSFTLTPADRGNTIYLNGEKLPDGSGSIALAEGRNLIEISNEAANGRNRLTYTIEIIRGNSVEPEVPELPIVPVELYTLSFETNGGSRIARLTEVEDTLVSLRRYIPERTGYVFNGWYADKELTQPVDEVRMTGNITVYAGWTPTGESTVCTGGPDCPSRRYTDLDTGSWYHLDVDYVLCNGIMNGTGDTTFSPFTAITRGMLVTILWRLEGCPGTAGSAEFADVAADQYYYEAVKWAYVNGIVTGYGDGSFGPNGAITREQLAAILYRYAAHKGYEIVTDADLSSFTDMSSISEYAMTPLAWANAKGLINGVGNGQIAPKGEATRVQAAAIFHRFCELFGK